ncbi:ABC transporter ATP-binding protein [bacterium]|nr:ABC transporter ATP-binding protein [bacterium]
MFSARGGFEEFEEGTRLHPARVGAAIFLCAALFPLILGQLGKSYWIHVGALSLIYVLLAVGLNIVVGFAGLLVLGFSAFYGIGAYVAAILTTRFPDMPHIIWALIPLAALLAALFGILLGAPTLRLRGDYLAIVTLGFGEIVRIVLTNWDTLTRGPIGISGVGPFRIGTWNLMKPLSLGPLHIDGTTQYYFLILMFVALGVIVARRLNQSRIGRAWVAFREDELAARSFGINISKYKVLAFAIAAAYAGVAGVFFASLQGFVDPTSFSFLESVIMVCMVVMGGMGSLAGSMVAAFLLVMLPEKLQMLRDYRMLIFGLVMILLMIWRPQGLIPSKRRLLELQKEPVR